MKNSSTNKLKILNDPIYGFIRIPNSLIFDIIEHASFQRLRRVSQMGFSNLVYPGANHTRFHHALGCLHLMQKTINVLRVKGIKVSEEEENALCIAILLHDIGHGAFSHALEHSIVTGITHEEISLKYIEEIISILEMKKLKFNKLKQAQHFISSQLDIDRLDYLKRDSFYTGVAEGNISSDRLIAMMNVVDDELVIEKKGIYSVEKFLIARRLMYWQVYLHKTSLVAEHMLVKVLMRAKELAEKNIELFSSSSLHFFLYNKTNKENFDTSVLELFSKLDDYDILSAIKEWTNHSDKIISNLSNMIVNRDLLKIEIYNQEVSEDYLLTNMHKLMNTSILTKKEASYFVFKGAISNQAYNKLQPIKIVNKKGDLEDIVEASDQLNLQALSKPVRKFFICYPKKMELA